MKLTALFVMHEFRTQRRSRRSLLLVATHLATTLTLPSMLAWGILTGGARDLGPATFASVTHSALGIVTALLAFVIALDAVPRERDDGALVVTGLAAISNAGFVLRRWIAVSVLVSGVSLMPLVLTFIVAAWTLDSSPPLAPFVLPWVLRVVPITVVFSALGTGLGTVAGSPVGSLILLGSLVSLIHGGLNAVVAPLGQHWSLPWRWIAGETERLLPWLVGRDAPDGGLVGPHLLTIPATEAPWATGEYASTVLPPSLSAVGLSALALAISVAYLRRQHPDVRPWRIPAGHPVRTLLVWLNGWREALTPDPGLGTLDRAAIASGLVIAITAYAASATLSSYWSRIGLGQAEVEWSGDPPPTDPGLVPIQWTLAGAIDDAGRVDIRVTGVLENRGVRPVSHVACTFDRHLMVTADQVADFSRAGDRVSFDLPGQLQPGATATVLFHVTGVPAEDDLPLPRSQSTLAAWRQAHELRLGGPPPDLSTGRAIRAISRRRVFLNASQLTPVPRHASWQIPPLATRQEQSHTSVPDETYFPAATVNWALSVPEDGLLANSCGHVALDGRLEGTCVLPVSALAVLGGSLELLHVEGATAIAVLPAHRELAPGAARSVLASYATAQRAWPELDLLPPTVIVELPPAMHTDPWEEMTAEVQDAGQVSRLSPHFGRLVALSEGGLLGRGDRHSLSASGEAASSVVTSFASKRAIALPEQMLFNEIFRALAFGPVSNSAVVPEWSARVPLVNVDPGDEWRIRYKLPAFLADLQNRVGPSRLRRAVIEFVHADPGIGPGTLEELMHRAASLGQTSLDNAYRDFVVGKALPKLTLDQVTFTKGTDVWEVDGFVRNDGDGEAWCEVVLSTDADTVPTMLVLPANTETRFRFRTQIHPRSVSLDPDQECYRQNVLGRGSRIENRGAL